MKELEEQVRVRVESVRESMRHALERSGRSADEVQLVAVSKYANCTDGMISALVHAGCSALGENRPQQLMEKIAVFSRPDSPYRANLLSNGPMIQWHFIGSLQRNKIRRLLPYITLIHSMDSIHLIEALDRILKEETGKSDEFGIAFPEKMKVLLEVNIAGEENKHGFEPDRLIEEIPQAVSFERVEVIGLMGMGALEASIGQVRLQFAKLRKLRDECQRQGYTGINELSMGMSHDFEMAIEEGATIIRVGSILYPNFN